jgi:ABC-type uncharacterized transport system permease subunit
MIQNRAVSYYFLLPLLFLVCGGMISTPTGVVNLGKLEGNVECVWFFATMPGNKVEIRIGQVNFYLN